jgi:hypothetical protein
LSAAEQLSLSVTSAAKPLLYMFDLIHLLGLCRLFPILFLGKEIIPFYLVAQIFQDMGRECLFVRAKILFDVMFLIVLRDLFLFNAKELFQRRKRLLKRLLVNVIPAFPALFRNTPYILMTKRLFYRVPTQCQRANCLMHNKFSLQHNFHSYSPSPIPKSVFSTNPTKACMPRGRTVSSKDRYTSPR